jgi:hypothetical protein
MYETLFDIEADLKRLTEMVATAPVFVPKTDYLTLLDILRRVALKADKAVAAGAVRPVSTTQ